MAVEELCCGVNPEPCSTECIEVFEEEPVG
jgi:hypothetical protein